MLPLSTSVALFMSMMKTWPVGAWLGTKKAKDRVVETLRAGVPLNDWLARHVG